MLLRGQVPEDQLEFDPEIEKTARRNQSKKREEKKKQGQAKGESSNTLNSHNQTEFQMAENRQNPPRRTLGDYAMQQGPRHFSSIVIPPATKSLEMKPAFLSLISTHQFTGMDHEDPYTHLSTFYELVGTMGFKENDIEFVYLRLFPFSLVGKAKEWLKSHPNQSLSSWNDVEEKFLHRFFPLSRYIKAKSDISTFGQGPDEPFCEAWERFKVMLRKCPNHGFEDIAQLNIFHNGLRPDTKMILDAAAGVQKKGVLDLSTSDAILAQNKILTQQIEALTKQMSKLPQQLHAVNSPSMQNQALKCDFCGGNHLNGQCSYQNPSEEEVQFMNNQGRQGGFAYNYPNNMAQGWRNNPNQGFGWKQEAESSNRQVPYQQQPHYPSIHERTSKLEDTFEKFMQASLSNQKNTEASIRNLETQVGQLAKQLADNQGSQFSANTQTNPKEHCNSITTRSGIVIGKGIGKNLVVGEEVLKDKESEKEQTLKQMPTYAKFMKELLTKKRKINDQEIVELEAGCSAIIQKSLPQKSRDPGSFTLPVTIGNLTVGKALLDLGASINLMPLSMLKKIGDVKVKPTRMTL
ncbi:uncharacterized protein [Phaseolus vulgaris]|uniref:uncharacterized protein n=1 Tax=Phaseolus vulgaris TaxID=3885 RepID=UPI0035CB67C6